MVNCAADLKLGQVTLFNVEDGERRGKNRRGGWDMAEWTGGCGVRWSNFYVKSPSLVQVSVSMVG